MCTSPISSTVDFDKPGMQHGFLKLPYSRDESAWGSLMIPITVAGNGSGPTAILTGANHGDEYEGPVALLDLAQRLRPEQINGRVIIIPMMNYPAFKAGKRNSPIDNGNMNRVFPGKPDGTVTEKIADYFQRTLLPMTDYVLDIHSGGKTLEFLPFAAVHVLSDKEQQAKCVAAMEAFNAPYSVTLLEMDNTGMYDTAAEDLGKVFVSTELGGGGTTTADTVSIAKRGVNNFLAHAGILTVESTVHPSIHLDMPDKRCYVTSESQGLVEHCVNLGAEVKQGDVLMRVHDINRTGQPPVDYHAGIDGILVGRHFPGLISYGDFVALVAVPR
ncbi:MAG: N(2)-acetyl-L-2,4-diaminobutanoate deacetylase DoeB [Arenicellales bacterium]|nr:N(2)-acetyl-L-2,4-diaminobutanoate deacetylase DoeB [Arenicellales bacterium]